MSHLVFLIISFFTPEILSHLQKVVSDTLLMEIPPAHFQVKQKQH